MADSTWKWRSCSNPLKSQYFSGNCPWRLRCAGAGGLDVAHPEVVEEAFQELALVVVEVALGFLLNDSEEVYGVFGSREVLLELLTRGGVWLLAHTEQGLGA